MKKCRTYIILCLLLVLCFGLVNTINDLYENEYLSNNDTSLTSNTNHNANENFYIVTVQDDIYIESDTKYDILQNNKYKIKANSKITIFYNSYATTTTTSDTISIDSVYFEHLGFYVNGEFYDKNYFIESNITINSNTLIELATSTYKLVGIGAYQNVTDKQITTNDLIISLSFDNNTISTINSFASLILLQENFKITTNIDYNSTINDKSFIINFETFDEAKSLCTFALYSDSSKFQFVILEEANLNKNKEIENSLTYCINYDNITKINMNFYNNLSYKNR